MRRVLIVEDEAPISMLIEAIVEDCDYVVAAVAANINQAMSEITAGNFDMALLDINLCGQKAHALPVMLTARNKPFAFVTGYGNSGILQKFSNAPVVTKPFLITQITTTLVLLSEQLRHGKPSQDDGTDAAAKKR